MKLGCLLIGLLAAVAGNVCADPAATLVCNQAGAENSLIPSGDLNGAGCFSSQFINANVWDTLDWGTLGPAIQNHNFFPLVEGGGGLTLNTSGVDDVGVSLAPGYSGPEDGTTVQRYDNAANVWDASPVDFFGNPAGPARYVGSGFFGSPAGVALYPGHFNSPGPTGPPVPGAGYGYPYGDHLLELPSGGPLELSFLGNAVSIVWFELSALTGAADGNFNASVQAFDGSGNSLGTYNILATGSGGACVSLGSPAPVPCNDAPGIGFYDPEGRIRSIYITAFDPTVGNGFTNNMGFLIDSVELDPPVPEPAMLLLVGGGLVAIAFYGRKRRPLAE